MVDVRICAEVFGLGVDENGKPCNAGVCMSIGTAEEPLTKERYKELTESIRKEKFLEICCMDGIDGVDDLKFITPEEYDKKYGRDEEGE